MIELVLLHKHWLAADSIRQFMAHRVDFKDSLGKLPKEALELGQTHSIMMRVGVFYSLLYVVVEGYQKLKTSDPEVDALLKKTHYTSALRRFRNATFHFEGDPYSRNLWEFIDAKDSEAWAKSLHVSFKAFFEKKLRISETIASGKVPDNFFDEDPVPGQGAEPGSWIRRMRRLTTRFSRRAVKE